MSEKIKKHGKKALIFGLMILLVGIYTMIPIGQAADCTKESDTISDSRPTELANHDIKFKMDDATSIVLDETVTVEFNGFTSGSVVTVITDWVISHDADGLEEYTALTHTTDWTFTDAGTTQEHPTYTFTFTSDGATAIGSNKYIQIEFTNGTNKLANPGAGVKDINIAGTFGGTETGKAKVAIIAGVGVTATVSESMSFVIANVAAASCDENIGGTDKSDEAGHNATTVPFGDITPETFYFSCQSLQVKTNAENGYTCTVQETDQLKYNSTEFPDGDCDGTCTHEVVQTWSDTSNDGFGYCMHDITGNAAETTDATTDGCGDATDWVDDNQCDNATPTFKIFPDKQAAESPENVMRSFSPVDDTSYIGYKINAAYTQTAGDYSNTTIYVATPTY